VKNNEFFYGLVSAETKQAILATVEERQCFLEKDK